MTESVLISIDEGVLSATLNEPETMNALTPGIRQGLADAVAEANENDAVRVLLQSKDVAEGFRSFIEKRPPRFTGE